MIKYLLYFLVGGFIITSTALLAEIGHPFLGGILLVLPNLSLVAFYFINKVVGDSAVIIAVKASLLGTIFIWPAYMLSLIFLIPKIGVNRSLVIGFFISLFLAILFVLFFRYTPLSSWFNITSPFTYP